MFIRTQSAPVGSPAAAFPVRAVGLGDDWSDFMGEMGYSQEEADVIWDTELDSGVSFDSGYIEPSSYEIPTTLEPPSYYGPEYGQFAEGIDPASLIAPWSGNIMDLDPNDPRLSPEMRTLVQQAKGQAAQQFQTTGAPIAAKLDTGNWLVNGLKKVGDFLKKIDFSMGGGSSGGGSSLSPGTAKTAATGAALPQVSWWDQELIPGLKNKYLVGGAAAGGVLLMSGGKRR